MKLILSLIIMLLFSLSNFAKDNGLSMKLIIKGLRSNNGVVRIALANDRQTFESYRGAFLGGFAEIKNNQAEYVFENIPIGFYALKIFHDEDNNQTLTTNFLGIPLEDYGFSNNARALIGIPSWDNAKFYFDGNQQQVVIEVK